MDATFARFVRRLLLDDPHAAGMERPRLTRREHRTIARAALAHGLDPITTHPADLAKAEKFKLWRAALPRRCGACLGDNLYIPQGVDVAQEGLLITHERGHGWVCRRAEDAVEADAWWITVDLLGEYGAECEWIPEWFRDILRGL